MNKYTYICEEVSAVLNREFLKQNKKGKINYNTYNIKMTRVTADDIDSIIQGLDDLIKNEENALLSGFNIDIIDDSITDANDLKKFVENSHKIRMTICDKISKKIDTVEKKGFKTEAEKKAIDSLRKNIEYIRHASEIDYNQNMSMLNNNPIYRESSDIPDKRKLNNIKKNIIKSNISFISNINKIKTSFKSICEYIKKIISKINLNKK